MKTLICYTCTNCFKEVKVHPLEMVKETKTEEFFKCVCPHCSLVATVLCYKTFQKDENPRQLKFKFPPVNYNQYENRYRSNYFDVALYLYRPSNKQPQVLLRYSQRVSKPNIGSVKQSKAPYSRGLSPFKTKNTRKGAFCFLSPPLYLLLNISIWLCAWSLMAFTLSRLIVFSTIVANSFARHSHSSMSYLCNT